MAALEPLGFTVGIPGQSSYRGGIHLYLPFEKAQNSWELASCLSVLLENAGFKLRPGQLEVFPNPRPFTTSGKPALFNAHRLPMQAGFYLLNEDFQPVWGDRSTFVKRWYFAASRNTVTAKLLRQLLKQHKRKHYRISGKADKFLNDLDTEIEQGWTGYGQTNRLLGRIALRTYVFHHIIQGGDPLTGQALVDQIVTIARSLPGYQDWCRHQHEIEDRAAEWARCAEASRYFHYTHRSAVQTNSAGDCSIGDCSIDRLTTWNQQQTQTTREKICSAIADLLEKGSLPAKPTARFQALLRYGIGGASLYRHRDLWHPSEPNEYELTSSGELDKSYESRGSHESVEKLPSVENPPHPPTLFSARPSDQLHTGSNGLSCTSLFPSNGSNDSQGKASSDRSTFPNPDQTQQIEHSHQLRLYHYLNSGDPILIAEAKSWQRQGQNSQLLDRSWSQFHNQLGDRSFVQSPLPSVDSFALQELSASASSSLVSVLASFEISTVNSIAFSSNPHSPARLSQDSSQDSSHDLSDLLAAISVQLRRLQWTQNKIRDRLVQRYHKPSRAMLTQDELLNWLNWLKSQK